MATEVNPIANFIEEGRDVLSAEGRKLIAKTKNSIIHDAAFGSPEIMNRLLVAANRSGNTSFRKKVLKALQ